MFCFGILLNNVLDLSLSCIRPSISVWLALSLSSRGSFLPFSPNIPSSHLLSKYVKIKLYKPLILPVIFSLYSKTLVVNSDCTTSNVWMIMNSELEWMCEDGVLN